MTDPATLAHSHHASVCAPAGYGKTELIARALLDGPDRRHLVLTHTHAGVHALRQRLRALNVPPRRYRIDTIAGWARDYAIAYPLTTGYTPPEQPHNENWAQIYTGVTQLLTTSPVRHTINATYVAVYVDEYQDCTLGQHHLIAAIAALLPCRILGDPLQAIFNFAEPTVDWNDHVLPHFPALDPLETPHRWQHDPALATWMHHLRESLEHGRPIDLDNGLPPSVRVYRPRTPVERNNMLRTALNRADGTTAVITQWADSASPAWPHFDGSNWPHPVVLVCPILPGNAIGRPGGSGAWATPGGRRLAGETDAGRPIAAGPHPWVSVSSSLPSCAGTGTTPCRSR